jgi:hypothetical protein
MSQILLPKYSEIYTEGPPMNMGLGGRFKLRKGVEIGCIKDLQGFPIPGTGIDVVTGERPWSNNIITDLGMNKVADTQFNPATAYCHVGSGTAVASENDTALATFIASENSLEALDSTNESSAPWYASYVRTWRFPEGEAEGIIAETAVSSQATTGEIYSRALVSDGAGGTTTIQVLSTEWLDVVYEHRIYPGHILANGNPDDATGTIQIEGVNYDYVLRPSEVDDWTRYLLEFTMNFKPSVFRLGDAYGPDAVIGAVTGKPTATLSTGILTNADASTEKASYSVDTFNRDLTLIMGLNSANIVGGIAALQIYFGLGEYQWTLDKTTGGGPVLKDNTKVWVYNTNMAWARAVIA